MSVEYIMERLKEIGPYVYHDVIDFEPSIDRTTGKITSILFSEPGQEPNRDLHQFVRDYDTINVPRRDIIDRFTVRESELWSPGFHLTRCVSLVVDRSLVDRLVIDDAIISEGKHRYDASVSERQAVEAK